MRKTCRWLGCAAVLCFTAVELSGCTSKPLISGFKLPGRKDRDIAVAQQEQKSTAKQSEDLLAQAREFEKAGDFPNASRAYREYLNGGGTPSAPSGRVPSKQVARTEKKPPEKSADVSSTRSEEGLSSSAKPKLRETAKKQKTNTEKTATARKVEASEDPWANEPMIPPSSKALPNVKPNQPTGRTPDVAEAGRSKKSLLDKETQPAEKPIWAEPELPDPRLTPDQALAADAQDPASQGVPQEELDRLLDLDSGAIDWGDQPETNGSSQVSSDPTALPETKIEPDLPLVDLDATGTEALTAPVLASDKSEVEAEGLPSEAWQSHEETEVPVAEAAHADRSVPELPIEEAFSAPVLSDSNVHSEFTSTPSLVLMCKDCEPWVYSQVMKLESPDAQIRKEGLTNLADMGSTARQASLAVRTLLQDPDPLVQAHAAWAIWEIENDPRGSVDSLRPLLDHSNPEVVQLACYMLGDIGSEAESATDALELLRDHAEGTTRVHAAEALVRIHGVDDKSLNVLTNALKSRNGEERWIAAVALGRCRGEKSAAAVTALTAALIDVDIEVRSAAALSLGGLGKDAVKAAPELERVIRMDDPQVRDAARAALACLKR